MPTIDAMSDGYVEWGTDEAFDIVEDAEPRDRYHSGRLYYPLRLGEILDNRYRIEHKLGFGTYSTVWMAHDSKTGRDVALKVLTPGKDGEKEYLAQNEIIHRVQDRSNLVTYHATFQLRGCNNNLHRVLVLPLIGPSLWTTFMELPMSMRMSAGRQLLVALKDLHDAGIVHRDLNDGAVMWKMRRLDQYDTPTKYKYLGRPEKTKLIDLWKPGDLVRTMTAPLGLLEDKVYLGDFGLAIAAGTDVEFKDQQPPMFCAPERYHNVNPSFASDMWSYMCIFAALYLGFQPFGAPGIMSTWVNTLGPLPRHWMGHCCYSDDRVDDEWYDQTRKPYQGDILAAKIARREPAASRWEQDLVLSVFKKVFCYEPADRMTAGELLNDPQFNTLVDIYSSRGS